MFNAEQILSFFENKGTTRIECEILQWYLSDYSEKFTPSEEETLKISEKLLYITFEWSGIVAESGLSLSIIMSQMSEETLVTFISKLEEYSYKNNNSESAILLFMRSIIAAINQREQYSEKQNEEEEEKKVKQSNTPSLFLRFALKYIGKQKDSKVK